MRSFGGPKVPQKREGERDMLKLNNVNVAYMGAILVLRGVSMEVSDNTIIAVLGANGAGKTTTLKAISGLLHVEEGEVTDGSIVFDGIRIDKKDPQSIVKMGISQVMEGRRVLEHLSVGENLMLGAHLRNDRAVIKSDLEMVYSYFPALRPLRKRVSGYLSGGEQQMLVMGRGMMAAPKLMLLDEPSLGLAPIIVKQIFEILERFRREQGTSVLLVEQNVKIALNIAQYGYVMENGRVMLSGPSDKLKDNEDVKRFYLGLADLDKKRSYKELKYYSKHKRWVV